MMKKYRLLPVLLLLFSLLLAACSSGGNTASGGIQQQTRDVVTTAPAQPSGAPVPAPGENGYGNVPGDREESLPSTVRSESKLILRASLTVESTEFDKAVAALDRLVGETGGYYESNVLQQGTYYAASAARQGEFTIRVPREQFEAFLSAAGNVGHVVSSSKTSEDVGEAYADAEIRLKTQRTKHERLLSLLEKADNMENIIALESALSEVEYEIERLSGTLRKYDSLVGYSTVTLRLNEVVTITEQPKETASLSGRIANAFSGGLRALGRSAGNLAVWMAYNFVGLLFFLAVCAAAAVIGIKNYRRKHPKAKPVCPENKE